VRSVSKLSSLFPDDLQTSPNVTIFTGTIDETPVLASCIRSATAIFCTIAQNENEPGCSLSQSTAHAVVLALTQLRSASAHPSTYTAPPLVWPSSAALNPAFKKRLPAAMRAIASRAAFHVLRDLRLAAEYLRGFEWIPVSFWQPGPIVKDQTRGMSLTAEEGSDVISYADVARGIVKIVEEGDGMWIGKEVGFVALGGKKVKSLPPSTFIWMLVGLLGYYMPSLWLAGRKRGLW
jgi:oxidoreductase AflX